MKKIQRFFWWCAGANLDLLEKCPTEHAKYVGIGGTIFFTAMMASFAGGYAIFTAFQNQPLAIFFGIFWGCMIFNLDRYIVSSIGRGDGTTRISRDEWINSSPRLLMAILLGFVIATPLELKIFEKEISVEIEKIINEQRDKLSGGQDDRLREIQRLKDRMAELRSEFDTLSGRYSGSDVRIATRNQTIREVEAEEKELNMKLANEQANYEVARRDFNFADAKVNDDALSQADRENFLQKRNQAESKMVRLRPIIQNYKSRLNIIDRERTEAENAISEVQGEIEGEMSLVQERNKNELQRLNKQLLQLQEAYGADIEKYGSVSKQYDGFMARLEALDRLCFRTVVEFDNAVKSSTPTLPTTDSFSNGNATAIGPSVSTQIHEYKERTPVYWARILITLMFIFIEIAPVLFKMMTEAGPYDDRMDEVKQASKDNMEAFKYQSDINKKKMISDTNERINTELILNTGINKNKLDAELAANATLLKSIAEAQAEIAVVAINKWKEQRMAEAASNPEAFLRTTNSNGHPIEDEGSSDTKSNELL